MSLWTCRTFGGLYVFGTYACPKCGAALDFATIGAAMIPESPAVNDEYDELEAAHKLLKAEILRRGYRIEVNPDGTERVIRPDGTVAITAFKRTP
jgi:hypothetical protein